MGYRSSHTGALNSRVAGWLHPTAVGCHSLQEEMMLGQWGQATYMGWLCVLAMVAAMGTLLTAPCTVGLQWVQSAASTAVSSPNSCHGDLPTPAAADGHCVVTLEPV